ncbi:MAG: NAD(P)-dependent oxidoreductase [Ignavibacteria bacterium]|nr:NAD(P)-dependent oxidoreductase [Ignavibacteria bacterium]
MRSVREINTILVTGDLGFIGHYLTCRLVRSDYNVVGIDINPNMNSPESYHQVVGSILDPKAVLQAMKGVDCVIHLAAEHKDFGISKEKYFQVNKEGTKTLLSCAAELNVRKFIFFSSVAVYGDQQGTTEDTGPKPTSYYGASKLAAEVEIRDWMDQDPTRQAIIIRPTVVFGPQNHANVFRLIKHLCDRKFMWVGRGENIKSVAYVENLVDATLFLLKKMETGLHIFNYSDEPHMTTQQMVDLIARKAGVEVSRLRIPLGPALLIARIFDILGSVLNHDFPLTSARIRRFDAPTRHTAEKIREWGFKPLYSLEDGFEKTVNWYISHADRQMSYSVTSD